MRNLTILLCIMFAVSAAYAGEDKETAFQETSTSLSESDSAFLLSSARLFADVEPPWPGFLTGMRTKTNFHEKFIEPVGNANHMIMWDLQVDYELDPENLPGFHPLSHLTPEFHPVTHLPQAQAPNPRRRMRTRKPL